MARRRRRRAVRASAGILMSRSMDIKDRVGAADSLARYFPRAAVPILIDALNEPSEPVRRAAARGLWTIARNDNPEDAAAARAAIPALRIALSDVSVSVAMNAAEALERLGEPPQRSPRPPQGVGCPRRSFAYERFLAARGLIGIDPGPRAYALRARLSVRRIQATRLLDSSGARDNIRVANAALSRLVQTHDRNVLSVLEVRSTRSAGHLGPSSRAGDRQTLRPTISSACSIASDASRAATAATAYELMAKLDDPANLSVWVPAAARALGDPRRQESAVRALKNVAGKTRSACPSLRTLRKAARPKPRAWSRSPRSPTPATRRATAPPRCLPRPSPRRCRRSGRCSRVNPPGPLRCGAARPALHRARFQPLGRDVCRGIEAESRPDRTVAIARLPSPRRTARRPRSPTTLRPYASASDPRVRQAAMTALDSIRPSWRESGERTAAVASGASRRRRRRSPARKAPTS